MSTQTATARVRVNAKEPFVARPKPTTPAHVIRDDAEAIAVARRLAAQFREESALRDREGWLPLDEVDVYSQSGLWAINVPKAYGGAGVSYATLAEVVKIISAADSSIAQVTQNHYVLVAHIDLDGTPEQKRELFELVLKGYRFGNAFSELNSRNVAAFETKVTDLGDTVEVNGEKFYTTGALLAHIVPIVAVNDAGEGFLVFADREAPGLTVINDWSSFGQRTTASGSVKIDKVQVAKSRVVPIKAFDTPTAAGAISQIIQAAIDAGIADGAIADTIEFVRTRSRPWIDSGKERAGEDPFTIAAIGRLAGCLVETSGRYPGWTPDPASPLLQLGLEVYRRKFGQEAAVKVIHAGLECGLLGSRYPGMDMLSFGPTIRGAHSPDERVDVATVQQFWELLKAILSATPEQKA